jgi:hypothetical protein
MNRAPTTARSDSHAGIPGISAGASAPAGALALTSLSGHPPADDNNRGRPVVGDTPLLILRRQK